MLSLFSDDVRRNPYPLYDQLRGRSPVLRDPASGVWMLLGYDGVRQALHDPDAFGSDVSQAGHGNLGWFIFMDPPRHTRLRGLVSRAFTPRSVIGLEPRIRQITRGLLQPAMERGEMELVAELSVPLPMMVIAEMLGAPADDWPRLRGWSDAALGLAATLSGGEAAERAVAAFRAVHVEMKEYLAGLIDERKSAPRDDLLTRLVQAEVEGERLSEDEILGFFQLLLLAGHETTTNLIDNAVLSLIEHPDQLALLRGVPDLLPTAVEEVLRYRSPVQAVFRVTRREVEMHGQRIPAGALVLAMIGAANRDPGQFHDAGGFDVTRTPNPHLAFGHGIHFCIGAPLARLEARVALAELLERVGAIEPASGEPWEPRQAFNVHGPTRLPIRFEPVRSAAARA